MEIELSKINDNLDSYEMELLNEVTNEIKKKNKEQAIKKRQTSIFLLETGVWLCSSSFVYLIICNMIHGFQDFYDRTPLSFWHPVVATCIILLIIGIKCVIKLCQMDDN